MQAKIFMPLANEGIEVWAPVKATKIKDNIYKISEVDDYNPEIEEWRFPPGSTVLCGNVTTNTGERIFAAKDIVKA